MGLAAAAVATGLAWLIASAVFGLSLPGLAATALIFALATSSYLYTTRRGKFIVWAGLLDGLALRGDERLLDVGCGRGCGAVLMLAAKRLPRGQAVGIDLWSRKDQSGNHPEATLRNAKLEGIGERVAVHTADMRKLPFPDRSFEVVTGSLAVHNIADARGREAALAEIRRVLKPGGTARIADIGRTAAYQRYLSSLPGTTVERRRLGWRFWAGGPQMPTTLVTVRRARTLD